MIAIINKGATMDCEHKEGCKFADYYPGCDRKCEWHPDHAATRAAEETKAADEAAHNEIAYKRNLEKIAARGGINIKRDLTKDRADGVYYHAPNATIKPKPDETKETDEYGNILDYEE